MLTTELPGRTSPYETSDVRPQVDGIIRARLFTEGDYVRAGQPLYRIDPVTYEARVANARAALARARALTVGAEGQVRRYAELVKRDFVSRQLYDNAISAAGAAHADVTAQAAALHSAQIDLDRTVVRAPISGRIGRSIFTTGVVLGDVAAEVGVNLVPATWADIPSMTATTTIICRFTATTANVVAATAGSVTFYIEEVTYP